MFYFCHTILQTNSIQELAWVNQKLGYNLLQIRSNSDWLPLITNTWITKTSPKTPWMAILSNSAVFFRKIIFRIHLIKTEERISKWPLAIASVSAFIAEKKHSLFLSTESLTEIKDIVYGKYYLCIVYVRFVSFKSRRSSLRDAIFLCSSEYRCIHYLPSLVQKQYRPERGCLKTT